MSGTEVKLLTYREAAELLRVSERKIWGLVNEGTIKAVRIGRQVRIAMADLVEFIERLRGAGE